MRTLLLLSAIALAACGSAHSPSDDAGPPDGGLTAPPADAGPGPDAGAPPAELGSSCATDADCLSGFCVDERELNSAGGVCSASCEDGSPCPEGSVCSSAGFCLPSCDGTLDPAEACERRGWVCGASESSRICLPACYEPADCAADRVCDGNLQCRDPLAAPRGGCRISPDCAPLEWCLQEHRYGFPDGLCARVRCASDADCEGGLCLEHTRPDGETQAYCAPRCADVSDCRDGYGCVDGACRPRCESDLHCTDDPFTRCDVASGLCVEV